VHHGQELPSGVGPGAPAVVLAFPPASLPGTADAAVGDGAAAAWPGGPVRAAALPSAAGPGVTNAASDSPKIVPTPTKVRTTSPDATTVVVRTGTCASIQSTPCETREARRFRGERLLGDQAANSGVARAWATAQPEWAA